jgi:hypothetical protein
MKICSYVVLGMELSRTFVALRLVIQLYKYTLSKINNHLQEFIIKKTL